MNKQDIDINPIIKKDPFNGTTTLMMIIEKCPALDISIGHIFSVEAYPGNSRTALKIIPCAVSSDGNYGQGGLNISTSLFNGTCTFSVLFEDGSIMNKELEDNKRGSYVWYLSEDDCESFLLKRIRIIRAETAEDRFDFNFEEQTSYLQGLADIFPVLIERFLESAAKELNWVPERVDNKIITGSIPESYEDYEQNADYCCVYLMNDTSNGYYKIGMSNNPEFRESTLQSEKPTIVKVCHKKYPSRKIAHAFESALHHVYESKRIRGEWFRLNEKDIWEIKQTLS